MGKILVSATGGGGMDPDKLGEQASTPGDVREGTTFYGAGSDEPQTGTLKDNKAWTGGVQRNQTVSVPDGIHKGSKVTGPKMTDVAAKTVAPNETEQVAVPGASYTLGDVKVGAISKTYVGSGITRQPAKTVTPTETAQTAVASGVYTTGAVSVAAISGTYVGSKVPTQTAKTVTPTAAEQTAVAANTYTTGAVKVAAIPGNTVGGNVTKKGATKYYATASDQTIIASGVYTTGAQTLSKLTQSNLAAGNIKTGVTVSVNNGSANVYSVVGSFTGDANATAAQILSGKTAYVKGSKLTGTIASMAGGSYTPSASTQTVSCSGKYMTSNITVNAIPGAYLAPGGTTSFFSNGSYGPFAPKGARGAAGNLAGGDSLSGPTTLAWPIIPGSGGILKSAYPSVYEGQDVRSVMTAPSISGQGYMYYRAPDGGTGYSALCAIVFCNCIPTSRLRTVTVSARGVWHSSSGAVSGYVTPQVDIIQFNPSGWSADTSWTNQWAASNSDMDNDSFRTISCTGSYNSTMYPYCMICVSTGTKNNLLELDIQSVTVTIS